MRHLTIGCIALTLVACGGGGDRADSAAVDTLAATNTASAMPAAPAAGTGLAGMAGRWTGRATPESGSDTTPTMLTIVATDDTTGWMMELPDRPPMPMRVRVVGDSIMSEVGPYESVRRKGTQVTTQSAMHRQGDRITGITIARYRTGGADTVLRLRMEATKAP